MMKQRINTFFTSSINLLLVFFKRTSAFWILLLLSTRICSQNESYNYFVYGVKLKDKLDNIQSEVAGIFGLGQPEEVFYSVLYKGDVAYKFFNHKISQAASAFDADDIFDDYSVTDLKDGVVLQNIKLCKKIYKSGLTNAPFKKNGDTKKIYGQLTDEYYSINRFGDTTFYYIANNTPVNAGISIYRGIEGAIIAVESSLYSVYPLYSGKLSVKQDELDKKFNFERVNIKSLERKWIESDGKKLVEGQKFPEFNGTTVFGKNINNSVFDKYEKTVIILLDHITFCEKQNSVFQTISDKMKVQTEKILSAVNELSKGEGNVQFIIISDDVKEEIDATRFEKIEIISNSLPWKEQLGIFQSPNFLLVNKKGLIDKFYTIMDIEIRDGFAKGLKSFYED